MGSVSISMVSGGELAVIGTLAGAVVTGAINLLSTELKQESENKRRRGAVFLEKKADALISLNRSLANCDSMIDKFGLAKEGHPLAEIYSIEEHEVKKSLDEAASLFDRATIFLSEKEEEIIEDAILAMTMEYYSISGGHQINHDKMEIDPENRADYVDEAKEVLASKIDSPTKFS